MEDVNKYQVFQGDSKKPEIRLGKEGCYFAFAAPSSSKVELLLYHKGESLPCREISLRKNPWAGEVRSIFLEGFCGKNFEYNYRMDGDVIQDPQARTLTGKGSFGDEHPQGEHQVRCCFYQEEVWEEEPPGIAWEDMILYKLHVRGYTMQKSSKVRKKGTFAGLEEKIPYWKSLGINAIELMPAYEFKERQPLQTKECLRTYHLPPEGMLNFWGYTGGFYYAPKAAYCAGKSPGKEFSGFIRALHREGIECIMEFFFDDAILSIEIPRILRYWRETYHVDGFHLLGKYPPQEILLQDPHLWGTKLFFTEISTPALCKGPKRLGQYDNSFSQEMRRWLKGDEGVLPAAANYLRKNPSHYGVVNYMTSQDGFTLADLVSYNQKHNEANQEGNRDGTDYNFSWNCGEEGPSRKTSVRRLRKKQMRNAFLLLLLAQGTPMLYGGDEIANSQSGNNNAYCQDNETGWVDWSGLKKHEELLSFVKQAVAFRKAHPILHLPEEPRGTDYKAVGFPDISLHSQRAWYVQADQTSRNLGVMYCCAYEPKETTSQFIYLAYNMYWESRQFALPCLPKGCLWYLAADTSDFSGTGFYPEEEALPLQEQKFLTVPQRTIMILIGKTDASSQTDEKFNLPFGKLD